MLYLSARSLDKPRNDAARDLCYERQICRPYASIAAPCP